MGVLPLIGKTLLHPIGWDFISWPYCSMYDRPWSLKSLRPRVLSPQGTSFDQWSELNLFPVARIVFGRIDFFNGAMAASEELISDYQSSVLQREICIFWADFHYITVIWHNTIRHEEPIHYLQWFWTVILYWPQWYRSLQRNWLSGADSKL